MVLPALLAALGPELLAMLGPAAAGAGTTAGASALPAIGAAAGPTVAQSVLPATVDLASPLLATAQPFANAPAEALNLFQGASGGATDIVGRTAETGDALARIFGSDPNIGPASAAETPAAPAPAADPSTGGFDFSKLANTAIQAGSAPGPAPIAPPGVEGPSGSPAPTGFQPTAGPGIEQTLINASDTFAPESVVPSAVTSAQVQEEFLRRLLGSDFRGAPR